MELVLVRHPETSAPKGTCYGTKDYPLLEPVRNTTVRSYSELRFPYPILVASPLARARSLAEDLISYHSELQTKAELKPEPTSLSYDERLQEMDFGDWEGKLWNELPKRETMLWMADFVNRKTPNGEAFTDLIYRTKLFLNDWRFQGKKRQEAEAVLKYPLERLLVVAHSGSIRAIICQLDGTPFDRAFEEKIEFGSVHIREID